ncbi:MAG: Na/Pi cotransporter family protein [Flavobacteriales bacterium]|nr:Na/Pi cotransporter family protein [Flavobacteriales bacterium]
MEFGIYEVFKLVGALGFFIYGMKVMSEGIQKVAGAKMRSILGAMTSNRFFGVATGLIITCLVQSSSATTVMVVSFVNAGLLSLSESLGVIMGANVGTTITAWLLSLLGFGKMSLAHYALPIIAIGLPMMFLSNPKFKHTAEILIGFALLFMGLEYLKDAVPDIKNNPGMLAFFKDYADMGYASILLFVGVGTLLTVVVQSSSAAMALTIVMCNNGWIPFDVAASMVLGENIGTTITAYLASLIGNVHAKRAARGHFIFNMFGVVWMILIMPFYIEWIDAYLVNEFGVSPLHDTSDYKSIKYALALFHTTFNVLNLAFLIGFVPVIERLVIRMVPSVNDEDEQHHLEFIVGGITATPEISILKAKQEVVHFGKVTYKMHGFMTELISNTDKKQRKVLIEKTAKYEDITDKMEVEIADYLAKVSQVEMSELSSLRVQGILGIITDLERVGDIYYQMSKGMERMLDKGITLREEQRASMVKMLGLMDNAHRIMMSNLANEDDSTVTVDSAVEAEQAINKCRNELRKMHYKTIESEMYEVENSMIYNDLFSRCEKIGDHIINVTEALIGEKD